jgi:hypothetical protein
MTARVPLGITEEEPATKTDGLMWLTPTGQLAIWYNGAWRPLAPNRTLEAYGPTTLVPTPPWAAIALVGPAIMGPGNTWPGPGPYNEGELWFNTSVMKLHAFNTNPPGVFIPIM